MEFPCKDCLLVTNCSSPCEKIEVIFGKNPDSRKWNIWFYTCLENKVCPYCSTDLKYEEHVIRCPLCNLSEAT